MRFLGYYPEQAGPTLGVRLRTPRRRLGFSQAEFAVKVGLDEGSVCRWECGGCRPSQWMVRRVEGILDQLERNLGDPRDTPPLTPPKLTYFDRTRWRR